MNCRQCGQSIPTDATVCPHCGTPTGAQPAGGAPYGQPSYPPPGGPAGGGAPVDVPNYLVQSILVTVLCCLPAGIAAIVFAAQANSKKEAGDYTGALAAANKSKMWCWIAVGAGVVVALFYGILIAAGGVTS